MNKTTKECILCENPTFHISTICGCCDPKTLKKDTAKNNFFKHLAYAAVLLLFQIYLSNNIDPSVSGSLLNLLKLPVGLAVIFYSIMTAIHTVDFFILAALTEDRKTTNSVAQMGFASTVSHLSKLSKKHEVANTREENKEKLLDSIDDIEYYIGKIKRARSTKSILSLTDEAREEIVMSKAIMKGCQAKMLKAELNASIELLEETIEQAESKLYNEMNDK